MLTPESMAVKYLGERTIPSPLNLSTVYGDGMVNFMPDDAQMPAEVEIIPGRDNGGPAMFEKAGPREMIYFDPARTKAAIVTCGGLCPGLNNVIRSLFLELYYHYGIRDILGIRYGYMGLDPANDNEPYKLTPEFVEDIHKDGGTVLGSSRGPVDLAVAVNFLRRRQVNLLFCIGGDGTQTGAVALAAEAERQGYELGVVGIPKTIDNDIMYVRRTFGYFTAIDKAREVIRCAHTEAKGAPNGIAVVKLMGRDAGFIAAGATVASQDVNFTLVPETPFALDGEGGLLKCIEKRMLARGHAVIVVAEGAGQDLIPSDRRRYDPSGNPVHEDIGPFVTAKIKEYFKGRQFPVSVKYIDPSYIIRSIPANCEDSVLCDQLARNAAHAGMAGKTAMLVGYWYDVFIHVPTALAVGTKKTMDPESELWRGVLAATGQPVRFGAAVGA